MASSNTTPGGGDKDPAAGGRTEQQSNLNEAQQTAPNNKTAVSPLLRSQTPVKLSASSPAFKPSSAKKHAVNEPSVRLKPAPEFLPRQQQQQQQQQQHSTSTQLNSAIAKLHLSPAASSTTQTKETDEDNFMELPKTASQIPHMQPIGRFAIDEQLRRGLVGEIHATEFVQESELPRQVHSYHSLSPLGHLQLLPLPGSAQPQAIKAQSIVDGRHYCLLRIPAFRPVDESSLNAIDKWKLIKHPNVVQIYEAFTTRAFGDSSLILVYGFRPQAVSLKQRFLDMRESASEDLLWSITLQIASALRSIHSAGLNVHALNASAILLSPNNRVSLFSCGMGDILAHESSYNADASQQEELRSIGHILSMLLSVSPENIVSVQGQQRAIAPGPSFSSDFKQLFNYLNGRLTPVIALDDILRLAGPRMLSELDNTRREADVLHDNLLLEMSSSRLVRLMCKINFITERPELAMDPEWSETGDCYLIKLFRDYVFHLVNDEGKPVLDMAHVVGNLNKLDAGSMDKIMLMSRDEQSCLVVSYSEIKRCIDTAYKELLSSAKSWN
ncbi:PAB-dependent poly(A)-specific ribonuclease subunit 3 [Dipsacomyces acuminosporus]|nr:PAB-dependent poly(A)-specific ribonuclease subunit 3 [Dipsacomyces acuminosporus]